MAILKEREYLKYLRKCNLLPVEPRPLPSGLRCVAVIPACDELETIGRTLASLFVPDDCAVLVVVNHPADAVSRVKEASGELLQRLNAGVFGCPNLHWIAAPDLHGGVGEARKLGMDAVIASQKAEDLERESIASLDADTVVESDYFTEIIGYFEREPRLAALSIPFRHLPGETPEEERAIRRYEAYLKRYVEKLREAGSPYAFQTVGSAFAVRLDAYVRAGGMRIRKGGEDFYFLQAVAKSGAVATGGKVLVHPSARPSERVPFGTGPAIRKLLAGGELSEISDEAFAGLSQILGRTELASCLENAELFLEEQDERCVQFFRSEGFPEVWPKILANTPKCATARIAAFHRWFDGLRTLRCLHWLDRCSGSGPEN